MQTVLVTGATGFVGRALVEALLRNPAFKIVCAVRAPAALPPQVQQVTVGDISADTNWRDALRGVDVVLHLAARVHVMHETAGNPLSEFRRVNVAGTVSLAVQAVEAGVRRMVYLSSVKVHGESGCFTERDQPTPADPYAISKLEAENALRSIASREELEVVVVRPPLVYGPGVRANFAALMRLANRGIPLPLASVHNRRSLVALGNLVHFLMCCVSHPHAANETFLVSDGHDLSTAELVQHMARAHGGHARLIPVPVWLMSAVARLLGKRDMATRLFASLQVDISKARTVLAWNPPLTVDDELKRITNMT